jgi:hypothetical protein
MTTHRLTLQPFTRELFDQKQHICQAESQAMLNTLKTTEVLGTVHTRGSGLL